MKDKSNPLKSLTDPYTRAMFGENAVQVPLHGIVQDMGGGIVLCVFASKLPPNNPLRYGAKESHTFFVGDAVFRPRYVAASNHCRATVLQV